MASVTFYYRPWRPFEWRTIDGDTIDLWIDLGEKIYLRRTLRIDGIDVPELRSSNEVERDAAAFVAAKVRDWITIISPEKGDSYVLSKVKPDKFGRMLGDISIAGAYLSAHLMALGFARPYHGGERKPWTLDELKRILESGSGADPA